MYGTVEQNEVVPDEEENISNCLTTDLDSASSAGGTIRKELNDFWKNKSDTNELDMYGTVEQNELVPSSIVSGNVLVTGSIPDINLTTAAAKENDCTVLTEQNTAPNELTSCTVTTTPSSSCTVIASEHSISNVTAASKKCCSTFVPVITTKQNTTPASEQIGLTIRNMSVLPTSTAGEGHRAVAAANKTFTDSANRSKIEDAEITTDHLKSSIKVGTDSLKDNSNTAGEPVNESDKVTDGKLSSPMACISKYIGVSDESQKHGHADLQKVESESFIPDMGTEIVCLSNCDTELELSISVLNKDLEQNLNLALMSVLKKEVGESASQILAPSVMGLFKKELSCIIQKLMVKALSSVIDNITELKNQDTDSQYEEAGVTRVTRIVEEWKEEFMLVTERQMVEKEKASTQSNQEEDIDDCCNSRNSIDHIGTAYNDGTEDKNTLVESVQDFAQSEKVADCKMMAIPRKISDKGTQTVSTGCILYLKCLRDL
ncbi:hypothetical protein B7P43_G15279 [Cryptotermes secundus]|nr:hypothetical protein B7P43_G15279 [Cryptotermes secundus]